MIQNQGVTIVRVSDSVPTEREVLKLIIGSTVTFDGFTKSKDSGWWAQMCSSCVDSMGKDVLKDLISHCDNGICGVFGCNNRSEFYIDLSSGELEAQHVDC